MFEILDRLYQTLKVFETSDNAKALEAWHDARFIAMTVPTIKVMLEKISVIMNDLIDQDHNSFYLVTYIQAREIADILLNDGKVFLGGKMINKCKCGGRVIRKHKWVMHGFDNNGLPATWTSSDKVAVFYCNKCHRKYTQRTRQSKKG